jgi:hypothetical protein
MVKATDYTCSWTTSQTSESGDERESSKNVSPVSGEDTGKPKKSLFKKKIKKV